MSGPLFEGTPALRAEVVALIGEGRLDQAAYRARHLADRYQQDAGAAADAALCEWLRDVDLPRDKAEAWVAALREALAKTGTPGIVEAVRVYLAHGAARIVESAQGPGGVFGGEPVGAILLAAGLHPEAAESLFVTLARSPRNGRAALHLANALHRLGRSAEARDHYRRALRVAPLDLRLEELEDPAVRGLVDLAAELKLPGDVRPWLPALGHLQDVFPLSALDPVPGAGFGDGTRAYDLLIAHKGARTHGERLAVRRDLKELAPQLFQELLDSGKLEHAGPTGAA